MLKYISSNFSLITKLSKYIVDVYFSKTKLEKAIEKEDLEIVRILILKVHDKRILDSHLLAMNYELIKLLLENGADGNLQRRFRNIL